MHGEAVGCPRCGPIGLRGEEGKGGREAGNKEMWEIARRELPDVDRHCLLRWGLGIK